MGIKTYSKFYYDFEIIDGGFEIPFDEGDGIILAELPLLKYTPTQLANEIALQMTITGIEDYLCSFDRVNRVFTISSINGTFSLQGASYTGNNSALEKIGFDPLLDTPIDQAQIGINSVGSVYFPQFLLQSYVAFEDFEQAASGTVRKIATGQVETIEFGLESFSEFDIKYANDYFHPVGSLIVNNPNGVSELREFLRYLRTKGKFEFMPDKDNVNTFFECILEKSSSQRNGLGYKLKENRDVIGYFDTGKLTIRNISI